MNPFLILGLGVLVFGILIPASIKTIFPPESATTRAARERIRR